MKYWVGLLVIVFSIFLVYQFCYSGESFELNIPSSALANGSNSPTNSPPAQNQNNNSPKKTKSEEGLDIPADFSMVFKSMDGSYVRMSDYKSKYIFLNFWATWCPPCRGEMPGIQSLYNDIKKKDVVFICASDERDNVVADFVKTNGYTFPIYTYYGSIPQVYDSGAVPTTFLISKEGKIITRYVGGCFSYDYYIKRVKISSH